MRPVFALTLGLVLAASVTAQPARVLTVQAPSGVAVERAPSSTAPFSGRTDGRVIVSKRSPRAFRVVGETVTFQLPDDAVLEVQGLDGWETSGRVDTDAEVLSFEGSFVIVVTSGGAEVARVTARDATASVPFGAL